MEYFIFIPLKTLLKILVQTEIEDCQTTEIEDSQTLLSQPIVCGDVSFAHDKCFSVEETDSGVEIGRVI